MTDMSPLSPERQAELDGYLANAGSWANDRNDAMDKSRRLAWIIASIAIFIAFCEAMALLILTPLKTVVPYTLMVDKQTGYVEVLKPLEPKTISADTALTQSFLVQYVVAREGFDINALQSDYRKVGLWSSGPAKSNYLASAQPSNPQSPLATLPRNTIISVQVKSVSPYGKNTAMVRFDTVRNDAGGRASNPQAWVALINYRYSGEPMRVEDRYLNPLGFQVVNYTRNSESLAPLMPYSIPTGPIDAGAMQIPEFGDQTSPAAPGASAIPAVPSSPDTTTPTAPTSPNSPTTTVTVPAG
jgi:type IV secretion system protein VirB8